MISDISIFRFLWELASKRERYSEAIELIEYCGLQKVTLLWQIFFCTGTCDIELLEERIYAYGSLVKEQDYGGRELFLFLIKLSEFLKTRRVEQIEEQIEE